MFTGIIQHKGIVSAVHERSAVRRIIIASPIFSRVQEGDSVAIDGICSTVVDRKADFITVEYMQETVRRTTVGEWKMGKEVNIELSLRANSYMGGHFVQGHVDGVATASLVSYGRDTLLKVLVPDTIVQWCIPKGSIAVNGVSLTIADVQGEEVVIALIPYTLSHTTLGSLCTGERVNIEADIIAKTVVHYLHSYVKTVSNPS